MDTFEDFLEHHGIRGMKWGIRRDRGSGSSGLLVSTEEAKIHNIVTDHLEQAINKAKHEGQMEHIIDKAYSDGHVEGNMKVHNISVTSKSKVQYELSLYRLTPGKPSTHSGDGVKIKHIVKKVDRDPRPGKSVLDNPDFQHSAFVEDFLAHHGVKGMHWGIRKDRGSSRTTTSQRTEAKSPPSLHPSLKGHHVFSKKLAKKVIDKAAEQKVISEDAKFHKEVHAKVQKHGLSSLSNQELKKYNERFDMEKRFAKLQEEMKAKKAGKIRKLRNKVFEQMADRAVSSLASHVVDAHVEKFKTGPAMARMLPKS